MTKATHCNRGHERTPENVGTRNECRVCHRAAQKAYDERRRAARRNARIATLTTLERIRLENNRAGLIHYINRRRQRRVPTEGLRAA